MSDDLELSEWEKKAIGMATDPNKFKLPELLPCPFCGGKAREIEASVMRAVICFECEAEVLGSTWEKARAKWNTRPAVKLPEKPSELVALAMDWKNRRILSALLALKTGSIYAFCADLRIPPSISDTVWNDFHNQQNETEAFKALQAALEKEGL